MGCSWNHIGWVEYTLFLEEHLSDSSVCFMYKDLLSILHERPGTYIFCISIFNWVEEPLRVRGMEASGSESRCLPTK